LCRPPLPSEDYPAAHQLLVGGSRTTTRAWSIWRRCSGCRVRPDPERSFPRAV